MSSRSLYNACCLIFAAAFVFSFTSAKAAYALVIAGYLLLIWTYTHERRGQ